MLQMLQTYKGFLFVAFTAGVLYLLLQRGLNAVTVERKNRKDSEHRLNESEERFHSTLDSMLEGCQIIGHDWRYLYVNASAEKHNRRPTSELMGNNYVQMWPGVEKTNIYAQLKKCMEERIAIHLENEFQFPNGFKGWYDLNIQPIPEGIFILSVDITERKRAESKANSLNRVYRILSNINQLIIRTKDVDAMLQEACSIVVKDGDFIASWIGVKNENDGTLRVVASAGAIGTFLETIDLNIHDPNYPDAIIAKTMQHGTHHFVNNVEVQPVSPLWKQEALRQGFQSSVALPLHVKGNVIGVFVLFSGEKDFFTENELMLLDELSMDISFALEFREIERERQSAYDALQETEKIFSEFMAHSPIYIFFKDERLRSLRLSANFATMLGRPLNELLGKTSDEIFPPEFAQKMIADDTNVLASGELLEQEEEFNGRIYHTVKFPIFHKESARYLAGYTMDITERQRTQERLELLYKTLDVTCDIVYWINKDGQFVYINAAGCRNLGYAPNELLKMHVSEVNPRATAVHWTELWNNLKEKKYYTAEAVHRRKDGSEFPVEISSTFVQFRNQEYINGFARDITERKKSEQTLFEAEVRFRTIFDESPNGVLLIDSDTGQTIEANEAAYSQLEYTRDEFFALKISDYEAVENPEATKRHMQKIINEGSDHFETRQRTKSGKIQYVHVWAKSIRLYGRNLFYAIYQDVTEQKLVERSLRESEERYRSIVENVREAYYETNSRSIFTYCNPGSLIISGYSEQELLGMSVFNLIVPEQRKSMVLKYRLWAKERRVTMTSEFVIQKKNGERLWVEQTSYCHYNAEGKLVTATNFVRDIKERKESEKQIEMLAHALRSITECVSITDLEDRIFFVNNAFCKTYGYEPSEVIGKHVSILRSSGNNPETLSHILPRTEQGGWHGELLNQKKNGEVFTIELSTSIIRNEQGETIALIGVAKDISERKKMEMIVRESEERYRLLFENSGEAILLTRESGEILSLNPSACKMFGGTEEEIRSLGRDGLVDQRDHRVTSALEERSKTGKFNGELLLLRNDGSSFPAFVSTIRFVNSKGDQKTSMIISDLTQRKQSEEKLRESEERLRLSITAANQGLYDLDIQTGKAIVNDVYASMLGYEPETFVETYTAWIDRLHSDDRERVMQVFTEHISGKASDFRIELRQRTKSGKWKWILSIGKIIEYTSDGKPKRMLGTNTDIDNMKRTEEMQMLQTTALESAANGIVITDMKGDIVWVNNAYTKMTGYTLDEVRGMNPRILKSGKQSEVQYKKLWETILSGNVWHGEFINKKKDGSLYIDEMTVTPVRNAHNNITHFVGVKQDVTERNKAVQKIKEQAMLLNEAHDAIILQDMEYAVLYWNKGSERLFGWTAEEAVGKDIRSLVFENNSEYQKKMAQLLTDNNLIGEFNMNTKERQHIIADVRLNIIYDDEGKPSSVLSIGNDITEKKQIEAQFLRTQRMGSLGTLAGGIAHDLNNVMAPILLAMELLKKSHASDTSQKILASVESSARRGSEIVKQILAFARGVDTQKVLLQPRHLIKEIISIFKETFPRSITITTDIPNNTWTIMSDPTHFHQLIMNLGVNARDAMPEGGTLSIVAANETFDEQYVRMNIDAKVGSYVRFSVRDTGSGIAPGILDHVFEPFFTTKEVGKGTGLGLSTVYTIVKSHGGFITVQSAVGKGTTMNVFLPATVQSSIVAEEKKEYTNLKGNGELILVVDDEQAIREVTQHTLESYSYTVITATDGADAIAKYAEYRGKISLVLTDMMMPVMDGRHLIVTLRKIDPKVKIVASSGLIDKQKAMSGGDQPVNAYIDKPYTAETLMMTIAKIIKE